MTESEPLVVVMSERRKVIPVIRHPWPAVGITLSIYPRLAISSTMTVASFIVGLAVPAPVIVVWPFTVMLFLLTNTPVVHENSQAGITTVSPSAAPLILA